MVDTLRGLVLHARHHGDRAAVRVEGAERSYADLVDRATRLANVLLNAGLAPGDRVTAMVEDGFRAIEPHLAAAIAGLVLVPVNARFQSAELDHVLQDCGASALVHTDGVAGVVAQSVAAAALTLRISTGGSDPGDTSDAYERRLAAADSNVPDVVVSPDDLAMIGYTSGTTGHPKGAMMPHRSGLAAVRSNLVAFRVVPYGSCAFSGSISFTALLWAFIYPHLYVGATIDFLQPRLDVGRWFTVMQERRSTFTFVPTPLIDAFVQEATARPEAIVTLRGVCHSASPATVAQRRAMVDVIGERYLESYGMTESLAAMSATTVDDVSEGRADDIHSTIGRPLSPARITVVGEGGTPLPPGPEHVGELVLSGPSLFNGYWQQPAATALALREDGFHTGDLGHIDRAGYVYVDGRITDLVISGGMNVYPAEVERVLSTHPDIIDVAVIGRPHPRWGEAVCAVVVRRPGSDLTEDDVVRTAEANLAGYKRPSSVVFLDELPRNANMKVQKRVLREQLAEVDQRSS